ncbi:MAG: hypothetical protein QOG79_164, partial [Mycobacterium sp.]|nr:hypothetical protein [Mycobacterium sp.]
MTEDVSFFRRDDDADVAGPPREIV